MAFKIGDMVYSRVYGYGAIREILDDEHVSVEIPNDEFVVHISSLLKVGLA